MTAPANGTRPILLIPPMDELAAEMAAAVFRSIGYEARVLEENAETLAIGLQHTGGGECAPCPSTVGALIAAMQRERLPPEQVVFFMPTACGPCRFGQYAHLTREILDRLGWNGVRILSPSAVNAYAGLSQKTRIRLWRGLLAADLLRKLRLRVRPYEREPGATDRAIARSMGRVTDAIERGDWRRVPARLEEATAEAAAIPVRDERRPLVGVVGEIYVRFNTFLNGDLFRRIEALGGEAALAPMSEWVLYTNHLQRLDARDARAGLAGWPRRLRLWAEACWVFDRWERVTAACGDPLLRDRHEPAIADVVAEGARYVPWHVRGEAILTLGRAALYVKRDGAQAIVNASPMFCMPGTISTGIFPQLERELNVPIVCNFYDGSGDANRSLVPVMHYLGEAMRNGGRAEVPAAAPAAAASPAG